MSDFQENKRTRTTFIESDVRLLIKCIKAQSSVLDKKKECGVTPAMKEKVTLHHISN